MWGVKCNDAGEQSWVVYLYSLGMQDVLTCWNYLYVALPNSAFTLVDPMQDQFGMNWYQLI